MNQTLAKPKLVDWDEFGYHTMLACNDEARAIEICGLQLHAYSHQLQPEVSSVESEIKHNRNHAGALHEHLYDRPIPVSDASMLTHSLRVHIVFILALLTAGTCFASNFTVFWLLAWGIVWAFLAATAITALPLGLGHLAYEKVVSGHKGLQVAIIAVIAALTFGAVYQLAEARRTVMDKAAAQSVTRSYVDEAAADNPPDDSRAQDSDQSRVNGTLGGAAFMITLAAELALGFLVGLFTKTRTDEDYAAWQELKQTLEIIVRLEKIVAELLSQIEVAKKLCMAGIRRAQSISSKRRIPYHKALAVLMFFSLFSVPLCRSQAIERYEGILIDLSSSISRGGMTRDLFEQYLLSTKKLLATEPANSRVWVSSIENDSFGGVHEMVKGWTPDARGIFTDDLNRARRQLATSFEAKSSGIAPTASGTDIFGGLWHFKALLESTSNSGRSDGFPRTIWILSDMMNETPQFPMPALIEMGPERMLERARANGLLVPMEHYKIHVYGASPAGLTPNSWRTVKSFWRMYFAAAGAELVTYSAECDVQR